MAALYADGTIVWLLLAAIGLEAVILARLHRRTGRGIPPRILLPNLGAGACLIAAAGLALRGAWWGWIGAFLLAAGLLHALDLHRRWPGAPTTTVPLPREPH